MQVAIQVEKSPQFDFFELSVEPQNLTLYDGNPRYDYLIVRERG